MLSSDIILGKRNQKGYQPKTNVLLKDFYREKFTKFNVINIIGSHVSK